MHENECTIGTCEKDFKRKHQLIRHQESAHGIVHQSDTLEPLILW